ncbi:hypothetical protein Pla144_06140 [Bythopirellula polymerisocia]|uniref:Uncharacterized protein n=1 Tax=Bythopirellula polymerisocia TaxID=2528003 RepID=A0A5C6D0Y1_9BACT|nr:hypothetical protein Pla144_06140 [Bythopirellula polymerisocia]
MLFVHCLKIFVVITIILTDRFAPLQGGDKTDSKSAHGWRACMRIVHIKPKSEVDSGSVWMLTLLYVMHFQFDRRLCARPRFRNSANLGSKDFSRVSVECPKATTHQSEREGGEW